MSNEQASSQRRALLESAAGEVLEVGFGSGLNLAHYPTQVQRLRTVDPNPGMNRYLARRIAQVPFPVEVHLGCAESLPFQSRTFDVVVSTWTLCSIPDVARALAELRRVLRPGGYFLFIEHGAAPDSRVRRWQNWLTPLQRKVGDGCHLNRPIDRLISSAGFQIQEIESFYLERTPRIFGFTYRGVARPG